MVLDPNGVVELREESTPRWARLWNGRLASARWSTAMRLKRILRMRSVMGRLGVLLYDKFTGPEQAPPGATNLLRSMWTVQPSYFEGFGRRGLERAAANMERLHDLLAAGSVSLTVVVYPWPDQVLYGDRNSIQVSFWKRWCSRHGVQFIDLFPPFFGDDPPEERISRFFISNDTHLNERRHRLVAQHFLDRYR